MCAIWVYLQQISVHRPRLSKLWMAPQHDRKRLLRPSTVSVKCIISQISHCRRTFQYFSHGFASLSVHHILIIITNIIIFLMWDCLHHFTLLIISGKMHIKRVEEKVTCACIELVVCWLAVMASSMPLNDRNKLRSHLNHVNGFSTKPYPFFAQFRYSYS